MDLKHQQKCIVVLEDIFYKRSFRLQKAPIACNLPYRKTHGWDWVSSPWKEHIVSRWNTVNSVHVIIITMNEFSCCPWLFVSKFWEVAETYEWYFVILWIRVELGTLRSGRDTQTLHAIIDFSFILRGRGVANHPPRGFWTAQFEDEFSARGRGSGHLPTLIRKCPHPKYCFHTGSLCK